MMWPRLNQARMIACLRNRAYTSSATASSKTLLQTNKQLKQTLQGRDILFYQAPAGVKRTFFFMYISAGVQLLFWGNLASLAYVTYSQKSGDEEDAPVVLAPKYKRVAIAGGLVAVGIGIATLMCVYPWRYVDQLWLLKGGQHVRLVTHAKLPSHRSREYPIQQLYSKQKIFTGVGPTGTDALGQTTSSSVFLRAKGERLGYTLDRKGKFTDSRLFDGLWYNLSAK
ncbi:transmembrane protein 223-domain-containing protein [Radiomyces spectabilis]|uniref:transmembrane protein 223-domain-containing protein n=1 Tax=Radiomyces spectabilis TaxID=64574 RepID=UPI002220AC89|nr:transmembrane protein 223-domain-containing protein [Radiomyces spectabilis]KAI8384836.1 transmembrane protein 223-domain-containing protein [Radiomyces spectabilis]